jgi:hypothetical protein
MLPIENYRVEGNVEVEKMLLKWLDFVREGQVRFLAIAASRATTDVMTDWTGAQGSEFAVLFGLDAIRRKLTEGLEHSILSGSTGAPMHRWSYNLSKDSCGFDFHAWLVNVCLVAQEYGVTERLQIYFYPGADGDIDQALNSPLRKQMFEKVMRPMLAMVGAVESDGKFPGNVLDASTNYAYRNVIAMYNRGAKLPKLRASAQNCERVRELIGNDAVVSITLREAKYQPHRNSNLPEWLKFADWLKERGEQVVFVRDTDKAEEELEGYDTLPEASLDLDVRMALYQQAKMNYFVSNGPAVMPWFSDAPWMMIHSLNKDDPYDANRPDIWQHFIGVPEGGQFPWASKRQHFVWGPSPMPDVLEVMQKSWLEFSP